MGADALVRRPGRARHRQGAVPGAGGRIRRRGGPLCRPRRTRADRRRVRDAAAGHRCTQGARPGRPGHPRRPRRPHRQPHLRLGGRRRRRDRRRVRIRRRGRVAGGRVSARASSAHGDVRRSRRLRSGRRQADAVRDKPGPARSPHDLRDGGGHPRAEDPHRLPRHRRRFREQGRHLSGIHPRRGRLDRHRPPGEMGRGPQREPHVDVVRTRLHHAG